MVGPEFHDGPFSSPAERSNIRAVVALIEYREKRRQERREWWKRLGFAVSVMSALGGLITVVEKLLAEWKGHP